METLWRSCAKVREAIDLPFGVVSGVAPLIGTLDGGFTSPRRRGGLGFSAPLV